MIDSILVRLRPNTCLLLMHSEITALGAQLFTEEHTKNLNKYNNSFLPACSILTGCPNLRAVSMGVSFFSLRVSRLPPCCRQQLKHRWWPPAAARWAGVLPRPGGGGGGGVKEKGEKSRVKYLFIGGSYFIKTCGKITTIKTTLHEFFVFHTSYSIELGSQITRSYCVFFYPCTVCTFNVNDFFSTFNSLESAYLHYVILNLGLIIQIHIANKSDYRRIYKSWGGQEHYSCRVQN